MQIQMTKIKINLRRLKTITKCQFIISETKKNIISNIYALKKIFLNFKKKKTHPLKFRTLKKTNFIGLASAIVQSVALFAVTDKITVR